ncbi:MAG: insulinase family protein [Bacilli bacterium]|nr:insulinase family protein [Bacilli bacterium]
MREIKLSGLDMNLYLDTLDNGLEVIMLPYTNKKNYFVSYATKYGSEITKFIPVGEKKEIKVPDGIAHFLEHKMFEQEDGVDPFTFFSESGTGSNASTSFDYTQYICYGTKNFDENLRYLLNFVNKPYYTDENVEKEKGIIAEELKMYDDIAEFKLEMKIRENLYHSHPRRIDIGGSIPEIMTITKEDLYTCYNSFYSPNNMFVLVVGNFDVDKTMEIIREVVGPIKNRGEAIISEVEEKEKIRLGFEEYSYPINVPKLGVGIKVNSSKLDMDKLHKDLYLTMITTLLFGSSSLFRERVRNKKILNNFYTEWESINKYHSFYIMASSDNPKELLDEIENEINGKSFDEESFNRMKKVWIANEVKMIDDIDSTVHNLFDDLLKYNEVITNKIDVIRNLDYNTMIDVFNDLDFNNKSVVIMRNIETI